jgi:hypothetical protein
LTNLARAGYRSLAKASLRLFGLVLVDAFLEDASISALPVAFPNQIPPRFFETKSLFFCSGLKSLC